MLDSRPDLDRKSPARGVFAATLDPADIAIAMGTDGEDGEVEAEEEVDEAEDAAEGVGEAGDLPKVTEYCVRPSSPNLTTRTVQALPILRTRLCDSVGCMLFEGA